MTIPYLLFGTVITIEDLIKKAKKQVNKIKMLIELSWESDIENCSYYI